MPQRQHLNRGCCYAVIQRIANPRELNAPDSHDPRMMDEQADLRLRRNQCESALDFRSDEARRIRPIGSPHQLDAAPSWRMARGVRLTGSGLLNRDAEDCVARLLHRQARRDRPPLSIRGVRLPVPGSVRALGIIGGYDRDSGAFFERVALDNHLAGHDFSGCNSHITNPDAPQVPASS